MVRRVDVATRVRSGGGRRCPGAPSQHLRPSPSWLGYGQPTRQVQTGIRRSQTAELRQTDRCPGAAVGGGLCGQRDQQGQVAPSAHHRAAGQRPTREQAGERAGLGSGRLRSPSLTRRNDAHEHMFDSLCEKCKRANATPLARASGPPALDCSGERSVGCERPCRVRPFASPRPQLPGAGPPAAAAPSAAGGQACRTGLATLPQ